MKYKKEANANPIKNIITLYILNTPYLYAYKESINPKDIL